MIKKIYIIFFSLLFTFITQNNHGLEYYANKQDKPSSNTDVDKAVLENIKSAFKTLCDFCKKDFNTEYSNDISILKEEFDNIDKNSKVFDRKELVDPIIDGTKNPKHCACVPKSASATKGHIYNAAKIPVEGGYCIISQGPYNKTFENFFALLGENGANISISNVCNDEFINKSTINNRLRELIANKESPLVIKAIKDDISDNYLRDQYEVVMLDYYVDSDAELEYEVFSINGKLHLRIYNTDWEDDYSANIHKVLAIAVFIEKLNKLDIFEQPDAPIVSNCNSGISRAGSFISVLNIVRCYLKNHEIIDPAEFILQSRNYRPFFVFPFEQYITLKNVVNNIEICLPEVIDYLK